MKRDPICRTGISGVSWALRGLGRRRPLEGNDQ